MGSAGIISLGGMAPTFLTRAAASAEAAGKMAPDERILVLVQLAGGNDGLNTVVPYADDAYHKARPGIGFENGAVLKIDDHIGLHPQMGGFKELYDAGELAIVQGVGYPNPNRSHFRSMDIWHTAKPMEETADDGWLGRALDLRATENVGTVPALAVDTGRLPLALVGSKVNVPMLRDIAEFKPVPGAGTRADREVRERLLNKLVGRPGGESGGSDLDFLRATARTTTETAGRLKDLAERYKPAVDYPGTALGRRLKTVSQLIAADMGTRIFFVSLGGFDTHADQQGAHQALMTELTGAISAFIKDLKGHKLGERVMVATFSEFGRRVNENGSLGTDHGTASQMFVVTPNGNAGLYGKHPSLTDLDATGDMKFNTDFREVYASLLEGWLGFPSRGVLDGKFGRVGFV